MMTRDKWDKLSDDEKWDHVYRITTYFLDMFGDEDFPEYDAIENIGWVELNPVISKRTYEVLQPPDPIPAENPPGFTHL